jgi:hypothetical protein
MAGRSDVEDKDLWVLRPEHVGTGAGVNAKIDNKTQQTHENVSGILHRSFSAAQTALVSMTLVLRDLLGAPKILGVR